MNNDAQADYTTNNGATWLERYIAFSKKWSPNAYEGFHEACGLFILSTIAARRIYLPLGHGIFTPLYIALCGRSSLYAKSTTARTAVRTVQAAGLDHLLLPDDATPQAFIRELTLRVPNGYDKLPEDRKERIKNKLAFAGQRGWFYSEFGQHLDAITKRQGNYGEFTGIFRKFDDCELSYEYTSIGRGSDYIERPYLALLALLTPADIAPYAKQGSAFWSDGYFARFAFIVPPSNDLNSYQWPEEDFAVPPDIVAPLVAWHKRLGIPNVDISEIMNKDDKPTGEFMAAVSPIPATKCVMGTGVREEYYNYFKRMQGKIVDSENMDLDSNLSRFHEKAMRIAMLLASLEDNNRVEVFHYQQAMEITERWRESLDNLMEQVNKDEPSPDAKDENSFLAHLKKNGRRTTKQLKNSMGRSTVEIEKIGDNLRKVGLVVKNTKEGEKVEHWALGDDGGGRALIVR